MSIKVYNTLTKSIEPFQSIESDHVKLYACGITVYDEAHIGHASQAVFFDIIRSYLEHKGFKVTYVRNFTDIDDKIIQKANKTGKSAHEISEYYINETRNDLNFIKVRPATVEPKVTEHINEIIDFIYGLVTQGYAYVSAGDVLFSVNKFNGYGKLSNRKVEDLIEFEPSDGKQSPADFTLWKASKPGEPSWESPWGPGRPGWHIECSVMARKYLGDTFDIHGGGIDLLFPHHENEIAQSESLTGKPLSKYWIHNGLVMVNNQKMSKSLGNFYTIKEAFKKFEVDVIRYIIISHHYSSKIDFSEEAFKVAEKRVFYFYKTLMTLNSIVKNVDDKQSEKSQAQKGELLTDFERVMDENFNTAKAIAEISIAFSTINKMISNKKIPTQQKEHAVTSFLHDIKKISNVLNFLNEEPSRVLENIKSKYLERNNLSADYIQKSINDRAEFKKTKDFTSADALRNELLSHGIKLLDSTDKTEWEISVE